MIGVHIKSLIHLYSILKSNDYNVIICFQAGGLVSLLKRISGTNTKIVIRESISPYNLLKLQHSKIRAKLLFFVKKIFLHRLRKWKVYYRIKAFPRMLY